jgi:hypothetical protein
VWEQLGFNSYALPIVKSSFLFYANSWNLPFKSYDRDADGFLAERFYSLAFIANYRWEETHHPNHTKDLYSTIKK